MTDYTSQKEILTNVLNTLDKQDTMMDGKHFAIDLERQNKINHIAESLLTFINPKNANDIDPEDLEKRHQALQKAITEIISQPEYKDFNLSEDDVFNWIYNRPPKHHNFDDNPQLLSAEKNGEQIITNGEFISEQKTARTKKITATVNYFITKKVKVKTKVKNKKGKLIEKISTEKKRVKTTGKQSFAIFEDVGLKFYQVKKGDTLSEISCKLAQLPEFAYLNSLPETKLKTFNIKSKDIRPGMLIPIPLPEENRTLTDEQFIDYCDMAIEDLLIDPNYGKALRDFLDKIPRNDVLSLMYAFAKQESGGKPLGQFEFHRWEKKHHCFSFSIFHILMDSFGLKIRKKLNLTEGQLYHPRNGAKLMLAFLIEKTKKEPEKCFPISEKKEDIAVLYNGSFWKNFNPDYPDNIEKYYNEAKLLLGDEAIASTDIPGTAESTTDPTLPPKPENINYKSAEEYLAEAEIKAKESERLLAQKKKEAKNKITCKSAEQLLALAEGIISTQKKEKLVKKIDFTPIGYGSNLTRAILNFNALYSPDKQPLYLDQEARKLNRLLLNQLKQKIGDDTYFAEDKIKLDKNSKGEAQLTFYREKDDLKIVVTLSSANITPSTKKKSPEKTASLPKGITMISVGNNSIQKAIRQASDRNKKLIKTNQEITNFSYALEKKIKKEYKNAIQPADTLGISKDKNGKIYLVFQRGNNNPIQLKLEAKK